VEDDMARRYLITILSVLLALGISGSSFALDNTVTFPNYEILSPKINQKGDVIKEQHLLISLRITQPMDAELTLTRIDEPKVVVASKEATRRLKTIALQAPTTNNNEISAGQDPIVSVSKKELLQDEDSKEAIQDAFSKSGVNLLEAYDDYVMAFTQARKTHELDRLQQLINQRRLLQSNLKNLHQARQAYEKASIIYQSISLKYEKMFYVTIVDKVNIEFQGALPIFNLTVRDIAVGKYELSVNDKVTGKRIGDRVVFFVKSSDRAAEEIIERVKEEVTDIWKKSN